ncbi:hypothetical protein LTS15_009886 [Exophiala xenobiotica]|nr:hypothetical protein LTS15_009886 [Exophiala xenobiotica]
MAQCYDYNADTNTQDLLPSQWVQCPSSSGCCVTGDECMDYNLCHFTHNSSSNAGSFSTYYVARCTDPTYTSPDCQKVCSAPGPPDAVYNYTTQEWMCCGDDSDGNAPAPDDLAVLLSGVAAIASQTLIPGSGSPTSSTAIASSSSSSSSASSSSVTRSSATLTTSSASPALPTPASASGSSGAQAQSPSSSSDSLSTGAKAGIGIGVALGTLALIGLLLYFFLLKRRRRNRNHNRNTLAQPPKDDYYAGHPMSAAPSAAPHTDRSPQEVYEAPTTSESSMSNGHDKAHASQRYELD